MDPGIRARRIRIRYIDLMMDLVEIYVLTKRCKDSKELRIEDTVRTLHFRIRVGIKKPTQKNPKKWVFLVFFGFLGFFKFYIFYENNTNFSLSNRFFMNK
jgi:hypothetical protein